MAASWRHAAGTSFGFTTITQATLSWFKDYGRATIDGLVLAAAGDKVGSFYDDMVLQIDGILDATQPRRRELTLPQDEGRKSYIALQQGKVSRAVAEFEKQASSLGNLDTIGEISIGCALGYLDFRYANEPWRPGHPKLTAWYEKVVNLAPLAETMPVG